MRLFLSLFIFAVPAFAFASEEASVSGFVYRVIDFSIFAGVLYFLLHKKIKSALEDAIEDVKHSLSGAEKAKEDAMASLAEYSRKISDMSKDLESMKSSARNAVEKEVEKIISDADATAVRLKKMAEVTLRTEFESAKDKIRRDVVQDALGVAEKELSASSDEYKDKYVKLNIKNLGA